MTSIGILITHHPQPNPGIAKRQAISALEPSEGCLLYPSPLFQPAFQPAATCQGRVQRARAGVYRGLARYAWLRMVRNQVALYHVELDTHDVLLANAAPAETYR